MRHSCVDAFSGAGGLGLGLSRAGYQLLLSFDNDPKCVETQLLNPRYFNHIARLASIDEMLNGGLLKKTGLTKGELFLLAGGPPCQGFSIQRIGSDADERNSLILKYAALVKETMPYFFIMENVPGVAGKRGRTLLDNAINMSMEAGYAVSIATLDAQDFGVPQRRRRVCVVGQRLDLKLPPFRFPTPITPQGHRITVRQAIGHLPPPPDDGRDHPDLSHHRADRLSALNRQRLAVLLPGQGRDSLPPELLANCHRVSSARIGHRNVYGRMRWDDVAPTITARFDSFTRGLFGHPEQLRSISLREGALLQTFPIDFVFSGNKVDIARQIGNAVPPNLAETLGRKLLEHFTANSPSEAEILG